MRACKRAGDIKEIRDGSMDGELKEGKKISICETFFFFCETQTFEMEFNDL